MKTLSFAALLSMTAMMLGVFDAHATNSVLPTATTPHGVFKLGKKPYPPGTRDAFIKSGRALGSAPKGLYAKGRSSTGSANNSSGLPPIGDQGFSEGSCTAWAGAYAVKTYYMKRKNPALNVALASNQASPRFAYNLYNGGVDNGAYGHEPFEVFMRYGCASMAQKPYVEGQVAALPVIADYVEGLHRRTTNYVWLWDWNPTASQIEQCKLHLDNGGVAAVGVYADTSFDNWSAGDTPWSGDTAIDISDINHMVCVCGYGPGWYLIANSWGTSWGSNGFIYISSSYFENYLSDFMFPIEGSHDAVTNYATISIAHPRRSDIQDVRFLVNGVQVRQFSPAIEDLPESGFYLDDTRANLNFAVDISAAPWSVMANTVTARVADKVSTQTGTLTNFAMRFEGATYTSLTPPVPIGDNNGTFATAVVSMGGTGANEPFVDITNAVVTVPNDILSCAVAGTNNAHVVGGMWVTNATIGGVAQSFAAAAAWTTPAIPLAVGTNIIVTYGTNAWGVEVNDNVTIVRNQGAVPDVQPLLIDFSSNLVTRMISVGNDGPLPFDFTATVTSGGTWLTVAPLSGSVTNSAVSLVASADRRSLEDGQYSGEISIATTAGTTTVVRAQITVSGNSVMAEANGPYTVNQGSPAVFSAAGTMGANLSYRWEVGLSFSSGYSNIYHAYTYTNTFIPETADVVLTVRNTNSPPRISADSTVLVVENVPPGVDMGGPYQGNSTTPVVFTAITVDPGIFDTHQWRWDFDGDGTWDTGWLDSNTYAYTYGVGGSFMAQCEAKDNYGGVGSDSASVLIERPNQPPVATAVVYGTTLTVTNLPGLGLPVSLSVSGSFDPDDKPNPLVYDWREDVENPLKPVTFETNRNDAVITTMPLTKPGVYKFHLVVFDGEYNSQPATVTVRVPGWQGEVICDGYLAKIPLWGVKATVTNTYTHQMRTGDSNFKGLVLADSGRGYQIAQLSRRATTMNVPIDIDEDGVFTEGIQFSPLYYVYAGQVVTGEVGHFVGIGGVNVHLLVGNGLVSRSDAMGSFGFGTVPESWPVDGTPYKVRIQKTGFRSDLIDLRLDMNRNSEVIALTPGSSNIEAGGKVCASRSGLAVDNVTIDFGNGWVITNREDGSYGPITVPPGTYAVKLSRATFVDTYTNTAELVATVTNLDLLIDGGDYSVYGEIFNAFGQVITNARVEVVGNDGAVGRKMSGIENASRAGYYDVTVAKGTNRQYVVSASGYDPQTIVVSIGGHTKQNVVLVPEPVATLVAFALCAVAMRRMRRTHFCG